MTEKLLVGLAEKVDGIVASYEADFERDEARFKEQPNAFFIDVRYSRACLETAKAIRAAMTEVDMYDAADEFVRTVPATVSTLRHIYINDFVVWLLAHMEGK